jgi:catechol 2,3-dioxygenase
MPDGTGVGHVHLKVTDLKRSMEFYGGTLGFDIMSYLGSAAFLSAGGYHHHIGLNTWESFMGEIHGKESAGLEYFTISLPSSEILQQLISRLGERSPEKQAPNQFSITDPDGIE